MPVWSLLFSWTVGKPCRHQEFLCPPPHPACAWHQAYHGRLRGKVCALHCLAQKQNLGSCPGWEFHVSGKELAEGDPLGLQPGLAS